MTLYLVVEAWRFDTPKRLCLRMLTNIGTDSLLGAAPPQCGTCSGP